MKPMHATMATRPCLSSAARYHVSASGDVFEKPKGSQNPKVSAPSICDASKASASRRGPRRRDGRDERARARGEQREPAFLARLSAVWCVALGECGVFLFAVARPRFGTRRPAPARADAARGSSGPGAQRGRRRRRTAPRKRPRATAMQCVLAAGLGGIWRSSEAVRPARAPLSSQRPGSCPLL